MGKISPRVDSKTFKQAAAEVLGEGEQLKPRRPSISVTIAALILILAGFVFWQAGGKEKLSITPITSPQQSTRAEAATVDETAKTSEEKTTETNTPSKAEAELIQPWFKEQTVAFESLQTALDLSPISLEDCLNKIASLYCQAYQATTWQQLVSINRPALLTVTTPGKLIAYAALIAISADEAILFYQGEQHRLPLETLGQRWTGEFFFIWQPPASFTEPLKRGDQGEAVSWLAEQFAQLDQQDQALATDTYNAALEKRIQLFQQQHGLTVDGVAGTQTLLRLNEATSKAYTLNLPTGLEQE